MKKIFMTLAAVVMAVSASAQVYVGGNVGIANTKIGDGDNKTTYKFVPEIGYQFDNDWAAGVAFGWSKGTPVTIEDADAQTKTFEVNPYVRYTFVHAKAINVFMDGGVDYKHYNGVGDQYAIGLKPGVSVNVNKFSFVAHVGFLGYKNFDPKGDGKSSNAWGLDLDGNNISFGVYYNF